MKPSNIIISDITNMKDKFCIAGWDTYERRMKRLMIDGKYWEENQIPEYYSIIVNNEPFKEPRNYPHRTENVNIDFNSIIKIFNLYLVIRLKNVLTCQNNQNVRLWGQF
jgi:hypothetical protein